MNYDPTFLQHIQEIVSVGQAMGCNVLILTGQENGPSKDLIIATTIETLVYIKVIQDVKQDVKTEQESNTP